MQSRPFKKILIVLLVFVVLGVLVKAGGSLFGESEKKITAKNTILQLDMSGVIMNGKKFLKNLKKYKDDPRIKAVLIVVNSPGGAVGPSQELYNEIKTVRDDLKKPVICVTTNMMASGAYYASMACNNIVAAPGSMVGSIGVIMEFAILEKLYDWAKVSRYTIKSGKFKDSGAEYRAMRDDEKTLFQDMINEVFVQFRDTVKKERKLTDEVVDTYADGRVLTGASAVKLGFADQVGFYDDAVKLAASEAKLGSDYEIYEIPKKHMSIFDFGDSDHDDEMNSLEEYADSLKGKVKGFQPEAVVKYLLRTQYMNQPMMLLPGYWE